MMENHAILPKLAFSLFDDAESEYLADEKPSMETLTKLHSLFGNSFQEATELLENCKIIKYQTKDCCRFVYKIRTTLKDSFTIYNNINYCQCQIFRIQVLEQTSLLCCKHVLAVKLATIYQKDKIQIEIVTDSQIVDFLNEQLNYLD